MHILQFIRYYHDQTLKRQRFRVAHVAERAPGGLQEPVFGPIKTRKSDFYACIAWHSMVLHGIALYLMVSHSFACHCIVWYGIAWYCFISYGIAWYCIVPLLASASGCISQDTYNDGQSLLKISHLCWPIKPSGNPTVTHICHSDTNLEHRS